MIIVAHLPYSFLLLSLLICLWLPAEPYDGTVKEIVKSADGKWKTKGSATCKDSEKIGKQHIVCHGLDPAVSLRMTALSLRISLH